MPAIFISHSSLDQQIARDVKTTLDRLGFEQVFLDFDKVTGFGAGEDWEKRLYEEVSRCHAVILVLTPNWLTSKWCFAELTQARGLGKVILPVVCRPLGKHVVLPEIQSVDLLEWNAEGLDKLEHRLRAITSELARGFKLDPNRPPFPGIHAFEVEDAAIYFGRDDETRAVIERLDARRTQGGARFLVMIGASGSGKSSLLKAGVLPQLSRRRREWVVLPHIRPEKAPMEALAKAIAQQIGKPDDWRVWHATLGSAGAIDQVENLLMDFRVGEARGATVLLPIDQFEEVFTVATPGERAAFLQLLASAVDPARDLPFMVIATGRSDVLAGLLDMGELAHLTEAYALMPMPLDRVPRLVEGPARVAGLNVEDGLAEAIARDVESPEALPLLAHALWLLYQRGGDDKKLSLAEYHLLGDPLHHLNPIQNSVRLVADQAIGGLKPADVELAALRDSFVPHLVRVRLDDGKRVRQPARLSELPGEALRLIHALVQARLLTTRAIDATAGVAGGGEAIVEVAHEALFKAWPTLDKWLTEEHSFLSDIERLKSAHEVWTQAPDAQKAHALLGGLLLSRARDWLLKYPQRFLGHDMAALRSFIAASAEAEDAEQVRIAIQEARTRRTERRVLRGAIAAALVFAVTALFAGWQYIAADRAKQEAQIGQSLFLASLSGQQRGADPGTAMLLALEALPDTAAGVTRPYVPQAELQLDRAWRALREQLVLKSHTATAINSAAFSPDGKRIVTASGDGTARLWDAESGQQIGELSGHTYSLSSAAFSPDGKRIVTAALDRTVRLWNAESTEQIRQFRHTDNLNSAAFSPDGMLIVSASEDNTAWLWDAESGKQIGELSGHSSAVKSAAFSPDGKRIVTAARDGTVRLWSVESGNEIGRLAGHPAFSVSSAAFSPDGARIVTSSHDGSIGVWDSVSGAQIGAPLTGHTEAVWSAAFSPDGKRIVTASRDKTVRLWSVESGDQIGEPLTGHADAVNSAAFSPDGKRIVTASGDGTARLWGAENVKRIDETLTGYAGAKRAAFSPDGQRIVAAYWDNTARLWDADSGKQIGKVLRSPTDTVHSAEFSPDGKSIVIASGDTTARLWDSGSGDEVGKPLRGHTQAVTSAAFSPDGKRIVTASEDGTARLWNAESCEKIGDPLRGHEGTVTRAIFSPDNHFILTASSDTTLLWNADSGKEIGKLLTDHYIGMTNAAFSPDSRRVVTASMDKTVRLWSVETREQIGEPLLGHTGAVLSAAFSPDGKRIVTASLDKTARLWDAESGKQIGEPLTGLTGITSVAFSPDGKRIVTASIFEAPQLLRIFPGGTDEIVAVAKAAAPRCLTADQRRDFFLPPEPPTWCIEQAKWPYDTLAWKQWLNSGSLMGKRPPLPPAP